MPRGAAGLPRTTLTALESFAVRKKKPNGQTLNDPTKRIRLKKNILWTCFKMSTLLSGWPKFIEHAEAKMRWAAVSLAVALTIWTFGEAVAQRKIALVIGNGAYVNQTRLDNPGRDARLIGATLQKIGFELVGGGPLVNLDKVTTDRMVDVFATMSQDADIALFYFSGHGIQVNGTNYLLPVDLGSLSNSNIEFRTLNANLVTAASCTRQSCRSAGHSPTQETEHPGESGSVECGASAIPRQNRNEIRTKFCRTLSPNARA
jgi:hypothetical protein